MTTVPGMIDPEFLKDEEARLEKMLEFANIFQHLAFQKTSKQLS